MKQQHDLTAMVCQEVSIHCVPDGSVEDHPDAIAQVAKVALLAIPDGWAKIDGEWVRLREVKAIDGCGGSTHDDPAWDRPLATVYERED